MVPVTDGTVAVTVLIGRANQDLRRHLAASLGRHVRLGEQTSARVTAEAIRPPAAAPADQQFSP
jgi:hypothetical protein